jgi:hypothetical protein
MDLPGLSSSLVVVINDSSIAGVFYVAFFFYNTSCLISMWRGGVCDDARVNGCTEMSKRGLRSRYVA